MSHKNNSYKFIVEQPLNDAPGTYRMGEFTGRSVQNVWNDPSMHRQVFYGQNQTSFKSNMLCRQGSATIDNTCVCANTVSASPYQTPPQQKLTQYAVSMFSPTPGAYFPVPTRAAQELIAERSPDPSSYHNMDNMPM